MIQHILTVILACQLLYIIWYQWDSYQYHKQSLMFQQMYREQDIGEAIGDSEGETPMELLGDEGQKEGKEAGMLLSGLRSLYEINPDLAGWIEIPDTDLAKPVVQGEDNEFYLDHDFYGEPDKRGVIFVNADTNLWPGEPNTVLYGHHMRDGSMFGMLRNYKEKSYYDAHPAFYFHSLYEEREYEIVSVVITSLYPQDDFKYYDYKKIETQEDFYAYYNSIKERSLYETGVTAVYGDELVTLCTCDYSMPEGRMLVIGKRRQEKQPR